MKTPEELAVETTGRFNDLCYYHLARRLYHDAGIEGEAALRQGLRYYGYERGAELRKKHLALGIKTNLRNMIVYSGNPPFLADGHQFKLTEQEDRHNQTYCSLVAMLKERGEQPIAEIYCEEVHPPLWGAYAPGTYVNLGKTLAQVDSDRCLFDVVLRPANVPPEERKNYFEEFDPEYDTARKIEYAAPRPKEGYHDRTILMMECFYKAAVEHLREEGANKVFAAALQDFARDSLSYLAQAAEDNQRTFDEAFLNEFYPMTLRIEDDDRWLAHRDEPLFRLAAENYYPVFEEEYEKLKAPASPLVPEN